MQNSLPWTETVICKLSKLDKSIHIHDASSLESSNMLQIVEVDIPEVTYCPMSVFGLQLRNVGATVHVPNREKIKTG